MLHSGGGAPAGPQPTQKLPSRREALLIEGARAVRKLKFAPRSRLVTFARPLRKGPRRQFLALGPMVVTVLRCIFARWLLLLMLVRPMVRVPSVDAKLGIVNLATW